MMQSFLFSALVPLAVLLGLTVWWMLCRKVPFMQRLAVLALGISALAWIVYMHPATAGGIPLLTIVVPIMTIGSVAVLVATRSLPWPRRRAALLLVLIGPAVVCSAIRVDGLKEDEMPIISWRWQPTPEEVAEAGFNSDAPTTRTATIPAEVSPGDWPSFRGPDRDGRAAGITFATSWAEEAPKELWRRGVGIGWSSFAAIGDYVFTQEQRGEDELVVCYEADTGEQIWRSSLTIRFDEVHGGGPRATPTFHEGNLYALGATGALQCLDASTGEPVWKRELTEDVDVAVPTWGFSSSPLVVEGLVIVSAGGAKGNGVLAYDLESGEPVWQAGEEARSYTSVHLATLHDVPQLLVHSNFGLQSFVPDSGTLLWQHEWRSSAMGERCIQPLLSASNAILMGSTDMGTRRIEINLAESDWSVDEQWTNRKFRSYFNDAVYHEGFAYGFDGRLFVCVDAATGERRWKSQRHGGQVLLLPDMNTLLVLSNKGVVILIEATPEGYHEVTRLKAMDGKTWNHPVIANGKLFVRNSDEAVCYQLPGWSGVTSEPVVAESARANE
jgi:outer membrane protein assembly factor BamB